MSKYTELKNQQAPMIECFFAFSEKQYNEGVEEKELKDKKIYRAGNGLFGTDEGLKNFMLFYDELHKEIARVCDPQEVYDYEFWNHECEYVGDDAKAIEIVVEYFGTERAKGVKRRFAYSEIVEPENTLENV